MGRWGIAMSNYSQASKNELLAIPQPFVLEENRAIPTLRLEDNSLSAQKRALPRAYGKWLGVNDLKIYAAVAARRECAFSSFVSTESPTLSAKPKAEFSDRHA